jgi:(p)ppGpp synthase/HD superfamily hydrolase
MISNAWVYWKGISTPGVEHKLGDSVIFGSILQQIALLNLGDVANVCLAARLHDLMEDHPVGFSILANS